MLNIMLNKENFQLAMAVSISQIVWPTFAVNTERNLRSDVFGLKCSDYRAILLLWTRRSQIMLR